MHATKVVYMSEGRVGGAKAHLCKEGEDRVTSDKFMVAKKGFYRKRWASSPFHPGIVRETHFSSVPLEPGAKADRILDRSDSSRTVS